MKVLLHVNYFINHPLAKRIVMVSNSIYFQVGMAKTIPQSAVIPSPQDGLGSLEEIPQQPSGQNEFRKGIEFL